MRILITGISGQVGAALVTRFAGLGTVISADRSVLDLAKPREIPHRLDELGPEVIINPAAYTAVDRAEEEQDLAFLVNATGPEALANWAATRNVPLVHFSTDYVFDGTGERPWREDDPVRPLGAYGASKLAGEVAVRAASGPHLIVRTSWVYAASGTSFLRTIVRLSREREELRIVADQTGSPTSAACIAGSLAEIFHARMSDLPRAFAAVDGLVHLAAGGEASWHDFARTIVAGLKLRGVSVATQRIVPITTGEYPTKAVRPLNSRLDLSRLRQAFNITPQPWQTYLDAELEQVGQTAR